MKIDEVYRGYQIKYRRRKNLVANIWAPDGIWPLMPPIVVSMSEGMDVLKSRSKHKIDDHLNCA